MSRYAPVELLRSDHDTTLFDCGSDAQTTWLRRHALAAQKSGTSRVYVANLLTEPRIAGYYALAAGSVLPAEASARLAAGTGRHPIPLVTLTRLGVDLSEQGRGLGSALVRDAFQRTATAAGAIGIRALLVHAESADVAAFYRAIEPAFEPSPFDPLDLVLLMKDLQQGLRRAAEMRFDERGVSDG